MTDAGRSVSEKSILNDGSRRRNSAPRSAANRSQKAANPVLREAYQALCKRLHVRLTLPPMSACGDNAGMIALVALDRYRQSKFFPLEADAQAHANLDEDY